MRIKFRGDPVFVACRSNSNNIIVTTDVIVARIKSLFPPDRTFVLCGTTSPNCSYVTYVYIHDSKGLYIRVSRVCCELDFPIFNGEVVVTLEMDKRNIEFEDIETTPRRDPVGIIPKVFSKYNARDHVLQLTRVLPEDVSRMIFDYLPHY